MIVIDRRAAEPGFIKFIFSRPYKQIKYLRTEVEVGAIFKVKCLTNRKLELSVFQLRHFRLLLLTSDFFSLFLSPCNR